MDVWLTDPDAIADPALLGAYEALLDQEEQQRHARYLVPRRRHDFLVSRALLRTALSRYCEIPPADWRFGVSEFGRPFVLNPAPGGELRFSLAHTAGLIACAVSREREIGLDVERLDRTVDMGGLARATFAPPEIARLQRLSGQAQVRSFFSTWTLKEAYAKARGRGLTLPFSEFWFEGEGESSAIRFPAGWDDAPERWVFRQVEIAGTHLLSLAIERSAGAEPRIQLQEVVPAPRAADQRRGRV